MCGRDLRSGLRLGSSDLGQLLGFVDWIASQPEQVGVEPSFCGAGAAQVETGLEGELLKLFGVAPEDTRLDCADDDDGGAARPGGIGDAHDRGVGAEVDDAPAACAQRKSEGEEAEIVLFPGGAREDCDRPDAPAPAACEPEEAPTK